MKPILALVSLLIITGCTTTAPTLNKGAFGVADQVITDPQTKGALLAIKQLLVGKEQNPLDGFEKKVVYLYKGEPIKAEDLAREIVWTKREALNDAMFQTATGADPLSDDAALRAEIESILKAAGVVE